MSFWSSLAKGIGSVVKGAVSSVPFVGSALGSVIDDVTGNISQKDAQKQQIKGQQQLMNYQNTLNNQTWQNQFNQQNARQDFLLQNQASMQKQGLQNAGISAATMNGGSTSVASVASPSGNSASQASLASPNILDFLRMNLEKDKNDAEIKNIDAQTAKTDEERKSLHRENSRQDAYDAVINNAEYFDALWSGKEAFDEYVKKHSEKGTEGGSPLLELPVFAKNKGYQDALSALSAFRNQRATDSAEESRQALIKMVEQYKLGDDDVINALKNAPLAEYEQLVQLTNKYISEKGLTDKKIKMSDKEYEMLEKQIDEFEKTSIGQVIGNVFDPNLSFWEKIEACIPMLLMGVFSIAGRR